MFEDILIVLFALMLVQRGIDIMQWYVDRRKWHAKHNRKTAAVLRS